MYKMTSARIKYTSLGWVGDSLGRMRHQRGQEETFEPPYLENLFPAWVSCLGKVVVNSCYNISYQAQTYFSNYQ